MCLCARVLHRVLLASTALLYMPETTSQAVFALVVVTLFAVLTLKMQPYIHNDDDLAATSAGWSLWLGLFYALLSRANIMNGQALVVTNEHPAWRRFLSD